MSRRHQQLRQETERRFYRLGQFLGCYLHENREFFYGSPENAVDVAIAEYPVELRQQVRRELGTVMDEYLDDTRLRRVLNDGLGVNLLFKKPAEARAFAEMVERKLLDSIKGHFERSQAADRSPR